MLALEKILSPLPLAVVCVLSKLTRSADKDQTSVVQRCCRDHSCGEFEQTLAIARLLSFRDNLKSFTFP
jgi:hypothetical protein